MANGTLASPVPIACLTRCVPGWEQREVRTPMVVGVLPGEGIGPAVVDAALIVLDATARAAGLCFEVRKASLSPSPARRLTPDGTEFCRSVFDDGGALLCGPMGGRSVYDLRAQFDLYCKLVPIHPSAALADASIISAERLAGVDLLIVRENVSGLYFGESGRREGGRVAYQHLSYHADEVTRIVTVAARLARLRHGRLSVVVKAGGVPEVSALWTEWAEAVAADHGLSIEMLDIDNASFQLIADARRFDVVVAPNLFGDILADTATVLLGSRGMSYSVNLGPAGRAVYQTGHGAAHDLTGSDRANPVAQILSVAMMLRESFGLGGVAARIETAAESVLASGVRTADVAGPSSRIVGTRELAECIAHAAVHLADEDRKSA